MWCGSRSTPVAIDTDISMVTCEDGNVQVSRMNIGGVPYESESGCAESTVPGTLRVEDKQERKVIGSTSEPAGPPPEPAAPRCNPATWNCTGARPPPASP